MHIAAAKTEAETESRQSNANVVWVVVMLLSFGVTMATVVTFCVCCYWQRRRPSMCCNVMVRTDVTGSTGSGLLRSFIAPPLRKRILYMRDNILYANGSAPTAKVDPADIRPIYVRQFHRCVCMCVCVCSLFTVVDSAVLISARSLT